MLSEPMIQLLTAFVDGELSQRERKNVMRLLNKSSEAREMLRQLQENAHKVKRLPRHKVEPSMVNDVLQAIAEAKAQPKPVSSPSKRRRWMPYVAATMAASLLIAALGVAYWNATRPSNDGPKEDYAQNGDDDKRPEPKIDATPTPKKPNPLLADVARMTETIVRDVGAPLLEDKVFNASFADLRKDGKASGQLRYELNREKAVQFEVTVKKNSEAMARLKTVLETQKINLVTDPAAKNAVDDKKVEYLVYAENLTSDELTKLMNELSESFVVGMKTSQKTVPTPYQRMKLTPLAPEEKQKVARLLGVESLDRKDTKVEAKAERAVVLLPNSPGAMPSAEAKQFIANQRRGSQPGAVQVLIKIRQE